MRLRDDYDPPDFRPEPPAAAPRGARLALLALILAGWITASLAGHALGRWLDHLHDHPAGHLAALAIGATAGAALCLIGA